MITRGVETKKGNLAELFVYEDTILEKWKRRGVFGWVTNPDTGIKLGESFDWPFDEAPDFNIQCEIILDALTAKLNKDSDEHST
tara:strand:+ start:624 stop:875 length:252 start_codon:yes stop_codon:yes gene_type:complete